MFSELDALYSTDDESGESSDGDEEAGEYWFFLKTLI